MNIETLPIKTRIVMLLKTEVLDILDASPPLFSHYINVSIPSLPDKEKKHSLG